MNAPLALLPFALLALATIVGVAIVLVLSDLLRRFVLFAIARLLPHEPPAPARTQPRSVAPGDASAERERTALPG